MFHSNRFGLTHSIPLCFFGKVKIKAVKVKRCLKCHKDRFLLIFRSKCKAFFSPDKHFVIFFASFLRLRPKSNEFIVSSACLGGDFQPFRSL